MSTFFLLPPRPLLGEHFAGYLSGLFPGLAWSRASWRDLADALAATVNRHSDVYVVHREELPAGETPERALIDGFGAEPGDEVVEVRCGAKPGELSTHRWQLR